MDSASPLVDTATDGAATEQQQAAPHLDYTSETNAASVEASTVPTDSDTSPAADSDAKKKGPLSRLSERAAQSASKMMDALPSSVRPVVEPMVERGRSVGSSLPLTQGIEAVDETLQSAEAQRVAGSAVDLLHAVTALTLMVLGATVGRLESILKIQRPASTSATQSESQALEPELVQHRSNAKQLYGRYKTVVLTILSKVFSKSQQSPRDGESHATEQEHETGRYDPHSFDKIVINKAREGVNFLKQVAAYSLSQASQFNGPGSSSVVQPAAHFVISKLPEDAKRVVKESRSPFDN